jgi:uncharacterized damage-inducible protein DinB
MSDMPSPASRSLDGLIEENRLALSQLEGLVAALPPDDYGRATGPGGAHHLGKHVRHILDHYEALIEALASGHLDYEHRRRDPSLEQDAREALRRLNEIQAWLATPAPGDSPQFLELRYPLDEGEAVMPTCLARELAFLTSHTVHHMALVGLLAEAMGHRLPEGFGVHPSTWRHWQRQAKPPMPARSA